MEGESNYNRGILSRTLCSWHAVRDDKQEINVLDTGDRYIPDEKCIMDEMKQPTNKPQKQVCHQKEEL